MTRSVEDFVWSSPHLHAHFSFLFYQIQILTMLFRSQFWHFHLRVTNQDLQCWRLWMKLSTSPCSRSIASIMFPRSGQSKQVLILLGFFSTLYSILFLNSFSSYLKEVWIVSSTCSIASFTCKWNYKYLTKMWCKKETWISRYVPPTVILSVFCLFRKTSLLFFLSLSAFVHVRRHFSNWPRKYMQRAWGKSATHFLTGWQKLRKAGAFAKCLDSDENLKP